MKSQAKIIIGLTGGIATGKSAVAEIFRASGAEVIDADQIAREVVLPGTEGERRLRTFFPEAFGGTGLNRRVLRGIVFSDPEKRLTLNGILHPLIFERCKELLAASARTVVVEAPLLFEAGFETLADVTVCTVCSRETQIRRLCARDGITRQEALAVIAAQMDVSEKAARSDIVLDTDIPLEELKKAAEAVYQKIKAEKE